MKTGRAEACPYCKGYPEYSRCQCTWRYKLRRLYLRWYRFWHRKRLAERMRDLDA